MKKLTIILLLVTVFPALAAAAEVRNLQVAQEGDRAVAMYDLVAAAGEQVAEVTVTINIDGKRRMDQLHLSGDFGKFVKVGHGKRIIWNAMTDLPPGFDGDVSWDVRSVPTNAGTALVKATDGGGTRDEHRRTMPRPVLPFTVSEDVWQTLENSEMYHNLPRSRAIKVTSTSTNRLEYTGSKSMTLKSGPPTDSSENTEIIPLGDKCISLTKSYVYSELAGSTSYICGNYLTMGFTSPSGYDGVIERIDELKGSLFPLRIGAQQSVRYRIASSKDRRFDMEMSSVCRVTGNDEAKELHPRLTGVAWKVHCQGSNKIDDKTYSNESDDYFLEDLGVFLSVIGQMKDNLEMKYVIPVPGSSTVFEVKGEYGSRQTKVYSNYDWTVGE